MVGRLDLWIKLSMEVATSPSSLAIMGMKDAGFNAAHRVRGVITHRILGCAISCSL